jgi:hypothetical protein
MSNVSEDSLKSGGFSPNLYVKRISIRPGSSIDSTETGISDQGNFTRYRRGNGTLVYNSINRGSDFTDGSIEVMLEVQVKDVVDSASQRGFWLNDYRGRASSVMYVLQSTNPRLTSELLDAALFDNRNPQVPVRYKNLIDYQIKEISLAFSDTEATNVSNTINDATGNRIASLGRTFKFQIPSEAPTHLTYFAFVKRPTQNGRARFTPHGMISVEKVIEDGLLVDQAFVFRDVDEEIWAGPVHLHPEQGWMEGAFHVSAPHDGLRRVAINNFKVQDERVFSLINTHDINLGKVENDRAEVSDAYVSRSPNNEATMMFTFDHLSYMIENSKYGKIYANSSQRLRNELLTRSRITSLSILRKRVVPRDSINSIGSTAQALYDFSDEKPPEVLVVSADEGGVLQDQSRYVVDGADYNKFKDIRSSSEPPTDYKFYGSIREVALDRIGRKRAFVIKDGSIARISDGKYIYEAQIEIEDGAFTFLKEKLASFNMMVDLMNSYSQLARNTNGFNPETGQFKRSFINSQEVENTAIPLWLGSIITLIETMSLLTGVSTQEKAQVANSLYALVSPETGTIQGVERYISTLQIFSKRFENAITGKKAAHARDKSSIAQSSARTRIANTFQFSEIFDANVTHNTGFEYISLTDGLSLTTREFVSRVNTELARYSTDLYDTEELQRNFRFITSQDAQALAANNTRYSHIAPKYFKVIGTVVDLLSNNRDSLDFTSVTATIQSILDNPANRDLDVYIERDTLGLLRKTGTGPTTERTQQLTALFESAAADDGIYIEESLDRSILRTDPRAPSQAQTLSSEEFLGSSNRFSSAPDKIPANTTRQAAVENSNSLSVLQELLKFKNEPTDKNTPQSESLENISFDLTRNDNFINKRLRPELQPPNAPANPQIIAEALQNLPEQIKLLTRSKDRIYNDSSAMSTTTTDSQTDAFVYNFSMIRVVEYLSGYQGEDARRPIWRTLDANILNSARRGLLCRIRSYSDSSTNIGAFTKLGDIPVYNEHFILSPNGVSSPNQATPPARRQMTESTLEIGFRKTSFTRGSEGSNARRLIGFNTQVGAIEGQIEYISSSITGAPTSSTQRLSGASEPTARPATETTTPPSAPVTESPPRLPQGTGASADSRSPGTRGGTTIGGTGY